MSGFTGEAINAKHAELIAAKVATGYPRLAAWFETQREAESGEVRQLWPDADEHGEGEDDNAT